jgi:hypothetical protein
MKNVLVLLGVLVAILVSLVLFTLLQEWQKKLRLKRRRWLRIRIPQDKQMTCRITSPAELAGETEYVIDDINMGGIAFNCNRQIEGVVGLLIKFPFADYKEAGKVKGKVAYCRKLETEERYRIGISYMRNK